MASTVPSFAVRGSTGISVHNGPPSYELVSKFKRDDSKACKCMLFSPKGEYFAWANAEKVTIVSTSDWSLVTEIKRPKIVEIHFSPQGTYLMTWELFVATPKNPAGYPNLLVYKSATGELVYSIEQKRQINWQPIWTSDECFMTHLSRNDVLFRPSNNLENIEQRMANQRVHAYSLSPGPPPYFILCFTPGKASEPSLGKLYQYPKFDTTVACKTFFQADKVEMMWNAKGFGVLLLTMVEIDKTGSSYYGGKQNLNYLTTKGDTANVQLNKEGPIHCVNWSPNSMQFCVIYGFVPAKMTIFNTKCEPIFEMGSGPYNAIHYNPQGNILLLGGFGNLVGNIQVWDMGTRKLISSSVASDTTFLQWSPDGIHYMTATTAPRLRVCNGLKMWHYSGSLLYERPWNQQEELWEVAWQNFPQGKFKAQPVSFKPVEGIAPTQAQASKQVYRPPSARGREPTTTFKLHEDEAPPAPSQSKNALKQKKKREAKKAAKSKAAAEGGESDDGRSPDQQTNGDNRNSQLDEYTSDDPIKMKKILRLKSKLLEIRRLKEQQRSGHQLEINQVEKIAKEESLLQEMQELAL